MAESKKFQLQWRRWLFMSLGIGVGVIALLIGGFGLAIAQFETEEFPRLEGSPNVGRWYSIHPEGAISALGEPYYANFKLGTENNVMVFFNGGGVSVNDYTEQRPGTDGNPNGFYSVQGGGDILVTLSVGSDSEVNPFRNWTIIHIPYRTGDFHAGAGQYEFIDENGEPATVYHTGYTNLNQVLDEVVPYVGTPDKLVVAGFSAGGFGAALVTDRIMDYFPTTDNVTVVVDSALLLYNWHDVSVNLWQSPEEISDRLTTDNITLDSLVALAAEYPNVKVLFASSVRDNALSQYQSYLDGGDFKATAQNGEEYQANLTTMVDQLRQSIPNLGLYIFEGIKDEDTGLTMHTILLLTAFTELIDGVSPVQWISDAVDGSIKDYGLELLN